VVVEARTELGRSEPRLARESGAEAPQSKKGRGRTCTGGDRRMEMNVCGGEFLAGFWRVSGGEIFVCFAEFAGFFAG
jgi:hypothetical protein